MSDLLQRLDNCIREHRLLARGQCVLVAVSGGVDSMVLLHVLHALAPRQRWKLAVAHFNHRLRGRSSDADERLVGRTAAAMRSPVVIERADVRHFAEQSKLSIEMAARKLRHEFFARAARNSGCRLVALAHHADDQVELFFLRLLRGAGGEGLAGMKWRSPSPADPKITLVRPLLGVTRAELLAWARENKVRFREDTTNASPAMLRNRIRHGLLPLLRKKYQPGLTKIVLRLMDIIGAEADAVGATARQWLRSRGLQSAPSGTPESQRRLTSAATIGGRGFAGLPIAVQRRVLQLQLDQSGVPTDYDLVEQLRRAPDICVSVGPSFSVARDAAGRLQWRTPSPTGFKPGELTVRLVGRAGEADFAGAHFHWDFQRGTGVGQAPVGPKFDEGRSSRAEPGASRQSNRGSSGASPRLTESFDADAVGDRITLRHWRPGDRFQPIGMLSAVKLQDWFVNRKIPHARRRELIVAAAESGEIFWVEGERIGANFKLTPLTRRRLVWRWHRQKGTPRSRGRRQKTVSAG